MFQQIWSEVSIKLPTIESQLHLVGLMVLGFLGWQLNKARHDISKASHEVNKARHENSWSERFFRIQREFWNDKDMMRLREWLSTPGAYVELKRILDKRRAIDENIPDAEQLSRADYEAIDILDKFVYTQVSCLIIMKEVERPAVHDLWKRLFSDYWVKSLASGMHPEVTWYLEKFSNTFLKELRSSTKLSTVE